MSTKNKMPATEPLKRLPKGTSISPSFGPIAGGTWVTITGANLSSVTGVTFGGVEATELQVVNATTISVTTPVGSKAGVVNVVVNRKNGIVTDSGAYTYLALPKIKRSGSFLVEETDSMDRKRRLAEQDGHRQLAKVNAREHPEEQLHSAPEGELQNSIQQHPWLDAQRFDGIDPNLNPEPPLNTDARREFDNERREQEMEKQLRLGNMPKFSNAPKPQGP